MALTVPSPDDSDTSPVSLYPDHGTFHAARRAATPRAATSRKTALLLGDLNAVAIALILATIVHSAYNPTDPVSNMTYFVLLLCTAPIWPISFTNQSLYKARFITRGVDEGTRLVKAIVWSFVVIGVVSIFAKVPLARTWLIIAFGFVTVIVGGARIVARSAFQRARRSGSMLRRVLVLGDNAEGQLVADMLRSDPGYGYDIIGFADAMLAGSRNEIDETERMLKLVDDVRAGGVIIAATAIDIGRSNRLIRSLTEKGIHVELSSTLCDIASDRLTIRPLGRFPMVYIEPVLRHGWRAVSKKAFDLSAAGLLLVVLAPLFAIVMLAIKLTSPGPVFFRQIRVGRHGREFEVLKFRTMVVDAEDLLENVRHLNEADGPIFKIRDDPRITRVGRFLRKSSIDELPQLINVLKGEMSLVGPRPALPREVDEWDSSLHNRLRVQPGITGMWQVNGRADAGSDYGQLDLYYVDNWTLLTDIVIIARTIPAVAFQRGAH